MEEVEDPQGLEEVEAAVVHQVRVEEEVVVDILGLVVVEEVVDIQEVVVEVEAEVDLPGVVVEEVLMNWVAEVAVEEFLILEMQKVEGVAVVEVAAVAIIL